MTTPIEEKSAPKPARRLLRLSVRALMLLVVALAIGLGWFVQRARVQRLAVAAIEKTGGRVIYDWGRFPNGGVNPKGQPPGPKWLLDWLGVDYFGHAEIVQLGKHATDAEMEHAGRLPRLTGLSVADGSQVTDAGAAHLRGLAELDHINLGGTKVTGACLANFRGLSKLKGLHLIGVPIADADLANLSGLTSLEILDLTSTPVTDAGLAHLEPLVKLKQLRLGSTAVSGPGLSHLRGMAQLKWLYLYRSKLRDLSTLPPLPRLSFLVLAETAIDDSQLALVARLPALTTLSLGGTKVTDAGLLQLEPLKGTLTTLDLSKDEITDAAAPALRSLERPYFLNLADTKITDATLDQLAGLASLRTLDTQGTAVTDPGLARLKQAIPQLRTRQEVSATSKARNAASSPPKPQGPKP